MDVAPTMVLTLSGTDGILGRVVVVAADGTVVAGVLSGAGTRWTLTEGLPFDQTYGITASATDPAGVVTSIEGTITTVKPSNTLVARPIVATEGGVFGVGQPVMIQFSGTVTNRSEAEMRMKVTTDKGDIEGCCGWLREEDHPGEARGSKAHWRPKDFWPADTQVSATMQLYGVDLGEGQWGAQDTSLTFAIGRKLIA